VNEPDSPRATAPGKFAIRLGWLVSLLLCPLPLLLLAVAATWRGRLFAIASLGVAFLPLLFAWARNRGQPGWRVFLAALAVLAGSWLGLALTSPTGRLAAGARVLHAYPSAAALYPRQVLGNWLPEVDQLCLGFTLMPVVDPQLTARQAGQLRGWTAEIYRELESDPEFAALGSVLPLAYAELRGSGNPGLHAYLYVPPGLDRTKPAPALVFFHGSGGNWKAYLWILARVADQCGVILIAPTCGVGAWRESETSDRLTASLQAATAYVAIDEGQLHLAGLSNGGRAVSELLAGAPSRFRSYILISPVFDDLALEARAGRRADRDKKILILTGAHDDRVPVDYVRNHATQLKQAGAQVELIIDPAADHFLMFSHRMWVSDNVTAHLRNYRNP